MHPPDRLASPVFVQIIQVQETNRVPNMDGAHDACTHRMHLHG